MTSTTVSSDIGDIHHLYCHLTGMPLRLDFGRERDWFEWLKLFTPDDLRLVITSIKRGIAKGDRFPGALRFSNLIQRLDVFEEEKLLALEQQKRFKAPSPRDRVLHAFRPQFNQTVTNTARSVNAVSMAALESLRKWKEEEFGTRA